MASPQTRKRAQKKKSASTHKKSASRTESRKDRVILIDHAEIFTPAETKKAKRTWEDSPLSIDDVKQMPALYQKLAAKLRALSPKGRVDIALFTDDEENLKALVTKGRSFKFGLSTMVCRNNRCHGNSAVWYVLDPTSFSIATGYAASRLEGEMSWRQHSWLIMKSPPFPAELKDAVVEPTGKRDAYFGVALDDRAAEKFVRNELDDAQIVEIQTNLRAKVAKVIAKYGASSAEGVEKIQKLVSDYTFKVL